MIKNLGLLARRADVSVEYFHWHWREIHGPLALRITAIRRYVQSHRLRDAVSGFPRLSQEGIAEVWVDDVATAAGLSTNPEFTAHAGPDEQFFLDRSASTGLKCTERVLTPGPPLRVGEPGVKVQLFLTPLHTEEALHEWLDAELEPLARPLPRLRRLTVARPVPELPLRAPYRAVVELSWPDVAGYDRAWASPQGAALRDAVRSVTDLPGSAATLVEEYRLR